MDDEVEELLIEVRAATGGFAEDVARMRSSFDRTVLGGFEAAGAVLERGLLGAIRKGSFGFEDLRRAASRALDQIANQALQLGLDRILAGAGGSQGALGGLLGGLVGAVFGLPGRAIGGPVAPTRPYLVGERGPELFVPASAGRVEPLGGTRSREVRVAIQIAQPRGTTAPVAMRRSARQIAASLRRVMAD